MSHLHNRTTLSAALIGAGLSTLSWPIINLDYFIPFAVDKVGISYPICTFTASFLAIQFILKPKTRLTGALSILLTLLLITAMTWLAVLVHSNSRYNLPDDINPHHTN